MFSMLSVWLAEVVYTNYLVDECTGTGHFRIRNLTHLRRTLFPLGHHLLIVLVWARDREF